jgi:hypothetical protein
MLNITQKKFRGGAWIGSWQITWPFITLEVLQDQLILNNELFKKEYRFTHDEIEKIEVKKYVPFFAHGIRITPHDKSKIERYYFWYWTSSFEKLLNTLREFGWLK